MPINLNINPLSPIPMTVGAPDNVSMTAEEARIIHAVSPKVEMEEITGGTRLTITDIDGAHEADIMDGSDGQDGVSAYVHIKWAASQPTQDSDMKDVPDQYIGIYSGDSETAPTEYTDYTWYKYKGETGANGQDGADGQDGQDGVSAYVHIKYAENQPTQDSDMKDTADAWMGVYSGSSASAPTTYTSYMWYQIKGATGQAGPTGPTGPGVPGGGTTGQILKKKSGTNYDTEWADQIVVSDSLSDTNTTHALSASRGKELADQIGTLNSNLTFLVSGPESSTENHVAVFDGTTGKAVKDSGYTIAKSVPSDAVFTDTWRPVLCNGTSIGDYTLNIKPGTNVSLSRSNGDITITSTDTNTWRAVKCNGTSIGNNDLNIKSGTNVSLSRSNGDITISSTDTNTWRTVQCNGTSIGDNTLNLKSGDGISLSRSNGNITITASGIVTSKTFYWAFDSSYGVCNTTLSPTDCVLIAAYVNAHFLQIGYNSGTGKWQLLDATLKGSSQYVYVWYIDKKFIVAG